MKSELGRTPLDEHCPQVKSEWLETRPGEHCRIRVSAKDTHGLYSLVEVVWPRLDPTHARKH